jgi:transcriptional regulator
MRCGDPSKAEPHDQRHFTYINPHFAEADLGTLHDLIERHPFGLLVAAAQPVLAAHIPFVLHPEEGPRGTLVGHTARADPIATALDGTTEVLVAFQGPIAYIRSRWYLNPGLPTYNFLAVHVYGRPRPLPDRAEILSHLSELVDLHEACYSDAFSLAEADESYVSPLLAHITPFSLQIEHIEGKLKLSQNRAAADRAGVIAGLQARGAGDDRAVAQAMDQYPYCSEQAQPLIVMAPAVSTSSRAPARSVREVNHGD